METAALDQKFLLLIIVKFLLNCVALILDCPENLNTLCIVIVNYDTLRYILHISLPFASASICDSPVFVGSPKDHLVRLGFGFGECLGHRTAKSRPCEPHFSGKTWVDGASGTRARTFDIPKMTDSMIFRD